LDRRLSGSQSQSRQGGDEEKNSTTWNQTLVVHPIASYPDSFALNIIFIMKTLQ
jgi:hypothetical protein